MSVFSDLDKKNISRDTTIIATGVYGKDLAMKPAVGIEVSSDSCADNTAVCG